MLMSKVNGRSHWLALSVILTGFSLLSAEPELTGSASAPNEPLSLWYRQPAIRWEEALPVGNGRIGAMVFGGSQPVKGSN